MPSATPHPRLRAVDPLDAGVAPADLPRTSALQFSESVRQVIGAARRAGLRPPVFRSPPRRAGVDRTIRRRANGTVVVAVRRVGRPLAAVQADVVEGVVAANELVGEPADQFRHAAWARLSAGNRPDHSARSGHVEHVVRSAEADAPAGPTTRVA